MPTARPHPLQAYLDAHKLNFTEAAELFGCADTTLSRIIKDQRPPSKELMQRMIDVTGGALLPNDFYKLPENSPSPASAA